MKLDNEFRQPNRCGVCRRQFKNERGVKIHQYKTTCGKPKKAQPHSKGCKSEDVCTQEPHHRSPDTREVRQRRTRRIPSMVFTRRTRKDSVSSEQEVIREVDHHQKMETKRRRDEETQFHKNPEISCIREENQMPEFSFNSEDEHDEDSERSCIREDDHHQNPEMRKSLEDLKADWVTDTESITGDEEKPPTGKESVNLNLQSAEQQFLHKWLKKEHTISKETRDKVQQSPIEKEHIISKESRDKVQQSPIQKENLKTKSPRVKQQSIRKWFDSEDIHLSEEKLDLSPVRGKQGKKRKSLNSKESTFLK